MTDGLEQDLREMLRARASEVPAGEALSAELAGRVARRRARKLIVGAGVAVIAAGAVAAGAITTAATGNNHARVVTSTPTTRVHPTPTTVVPPTTKTTPTSARVVVPAVASFGCPTSSAFAPFDVAAPKVGPRTISGLDPALVSRVRSYVGPRAGDASNAGTLEPDVVLGPNGWLCRVFRSNGGGAVMYVYPPSAQDSFQAGDAGWTSSTSYTGPGVRVQTAVFGHDPDVSLACPVFGNDPLMLQWMQQLSGSSLVLRTCAVPTGRVITKFGPGVYTFVDADGTRGVGVMRIRTTTPLDGDFGVVTCNLTGQDVSLCAAIISDYISRYPGSVPGAPAAHVGGVVTVGGQVGNLQFGRSTEAEVVAAIGAPDETVRASFSAPGATAGSRLPDYQALGYDCTATATVARTPLVVQPALHGPYCATIYYINTATKTLAAFRSTSAQYATAKGTTVGMAPADAQRREGTPLITHGCLGLFIPLGSLYQNAAPATTAAYVVIFVGPSTNDPVHSIESESNTDPVGMLFC